MNVKFNRKQRSYIRKLDNYRRLCRNYERYLTIAKTMAYFVSILFMLRYF